MNFILKQDLPTTSHEKPIEIHLIEDETEVGTRSKTILAKFPQISGDHAIFYKSEDGVLLVKDKSLNGIYVNDVKIRKSLKSLQIGDTIGFGVTSDQKEIGFVCVVCSDNPSYKVKPEIIDISDDDDVPKISSKPVSNSTTCHIPANVQENMNSSKYSNAPVLKDFTAKTIYAESKKAPVVDNSLNKHASSDKNIAFNSSGNSERKCSPSTVYKIDAGSSQDNSFSSFSTIPLSNDHIQANFEKAVKILRTSNLQSENIVPQLNNLLKNSVQPEMRTEEHKISKFSSSSSNKAITIPYVASTSKIVTTPTSENSIKDFMASIKNFIEKHEEVISHKNEISEENSSETSRIKCATNAASNFDYNDSFVASDSAVKVKSLTAEHFSLKECSIPLIRCDSKFFDWLPNVKNPFLINNVSSAVHKYTRQISQAKDENLKVNFHKNAVGVKNNHGNTEYKNHKHVEQSDSQKRKYPSNSNAESLMSQSTTFKKRLLTNETDYVKNNFCYDSKKSQSKSTKESESDSEVEMNYSQVEDIIYVSDGDKYLDFKSSGNCIHIKTEPADIDDFVGDNCIENLDNNNEFQDLMSDNETDNFVSLNQENDKKAETLESIKAFVSNTEQEIFKPFSKNSNNTSVVIEGNNPFPVLSQGFDSDIEDASEFKSSCVPSDVIAQNFSKVNVIADETKTNTTKNNFILNKDGKKSKTNTGKIQLIDAQPLTYRRRRMRGRDERVVDRIKAAVTPSAKKKKKLERRVSSSKKELLSKLANNSNLKNFKTPLKCNKDNDNHTSKNKNNIQHSETATLSESLPSSLKKSPTVKTRPFQSTSRMGFLVNDVENSPRRISKPVAVVEGHRKHKVIEGKNNLNLSVEQKNTSAGIPNKNTTQYNRQTSEACNKSAYVFPNSNKGFYPRDPRQNRQRIPSSSFKVSGQDSSIRKASLPNEKNAQPKIALSYVAYKQGHMDSASRKTIERPVSHTVQNNINSNNSLDISASCSNQNNNANKSFERPVFSLRTPLGDLYPVVMEQSNANCPDLRSRLIKDLLYLNTKWLEEQNKNKKPPPAVSTGAAELPLKYDSYVSYVSSFYPMLKLEIWKQMHAGSKIVFESKKQNNTFFFSILSYTSKVDLIELKCESVVNEKMSFVPGEGSIVILELKENSNRCHPVFGYIFKHRYESSHLNNLKFPHWKYMPKEQTTNAKHCTFYVNIKRREMPFSLDSLMKGNGLCCIQHMLRLVDALSYLKNSPIMTDILQPKWKTFFVKCDAVAPTREFNAGQMEVIECVTSEIIKSKREPKIILLQGPPGTGKTHTIIGLIQKFLSVKNFNPSYKILVTAPSNAAIDEIGCRLIDLNEKFESKETIKFVRVGIVEQVHAKMKPYTLDRKANLSWSDSVQKERELQNLLSEITKLKKEPFNRERNERLKYLEDRCKHLTNENSVNYREGYSDFLKKQNVLKESHIVLSTLSSCGQSVLLRTFKPNSGAHFSYCIVDESTQCTELEMLQPLMLGIRKLVLAGDHKQLPATVVSKTACNYGFERSAFERFHTYFEVYFKKTPMFTLSEQF